MTAEVKIQVSTEGNYALSMLAAAMASSLWRKIYDTFLEMVGESLQSAETLLVSEGALYEVTVAGAA